MSYTAFVLIFLSAFCHCGWNFFGKGGANSTLSFTVSAFINTFYFVPVIIWLLPYMPVGLSFWKLIMTAGFFNALAIWALLAAYRYGDYTYIYPLKNSWPPLMTAIIGLILGTLGIKSPFAYVGFFLILLGCLLLPFKTITDINFRNYLNKSTVFCILSAFGTAVYSTVDGMTVKSIKTILPIAPYKASLIYAPLMYFATFLCMFFFLFLDTKLFKINIREEKLNIKLLIGVSLCMVLGYSLVLTAYQFVTNISYVVAVRQIGIPISFFLGVFILKEKPYFGKILGSSVIIIGLIISAFF